VTIGVDLCFATDGVRAGAGLSAATAATAGGVADRVAGIVVDAAMFGQVDQAGPLAAATAELRDDAAQLGRQVQARHGELAVRAAEVAGAGEQLVAATAGVAGSVDAGAPAADPPGAP
jgi:hypothetical protein